MSTKILKTSPAFTFSHSHHNFRLFKFSWSTLSFAMMAKWHDLPPEIRVMVLEMVSLPGNNHGDRSAYAAVSREWQTFFEKENFQRLVLHQSCLPDFDRIVRRHRRRILRYVWLRVTLPQYDCRSCQLYESKSEATNNNQIFTNAIWELLKVLGSWKKKGPFGLADGGPVLELSAHSPSDSEHYFRDYRLDKDIYPHQHDEIAHMRNLILTCLAHGDAIDVAMLCTAGQMAQDWSILKSHTSVVGLLELRRRVLHPVSLCQVRWEAEHC